MGYTPLFAAESGAICSCIALAFVLALTQVAAFSEGGSESADSGFLGSVGDFFNDALDTVGETAEDAWESASEAAEDALDSTGEAANDAWNAAGEAAGELWDEAGGAWDWTKEFVADQASAAGESAAGILGDLNGWIRVAGDDALEVLRGSFDALAQSMNIAEDKAVELWNSMRDFAEKNDIDAVVCAKLMLAVMVKIFLGSTFAGEIAGDYIADTTINWFTQYDIESQEDAENALEDLEESLEQFAQITEERRLA